MTTAPDDLATLRAELKDAHDASARSYRIAVSALGIAVIALVLPLAQAFFR